MRHLIRAAVLAAMLTCAMPAVAAAQSGAGDNQYSDPFAGTPANGAPATHRRPGATTSPSAGAAAAAPRSGPAASASSSSASASSQPAIGASRRAGVGPRTLPFTGFDALDEAVAGAVLLVAGVGLRVALRGRAAHPPPRP